jgi:hypothetical protein
MKNPEAAKQIPEPCTMSSPLILDLLSTAEQTCPTGGDETSLLTLGSVPRDCRRFTDMLMVTTSVRMVNGVHGHTTSLRPRVALDGVLVLSTRGLQERLVGPSSTSDNADHATHAAGHDLLGA